MSLHDMFKTNESNETLGVVLDYGDTRIKIARAGGANEKFKKIFSAKLKPHRRKMEMGTLADETAEHLLKEAYAEAIVLAWSSKDEDGDWIDTIPDADGEQMDCTPANVYRLFTELPELFTDIQSSANQVATFRDEEVEEDIKN